MICEICDCNDSEDNPIIEIIDENNYVKERLCMMCYVEVMNDTD